MLTCQQARRLLSRSWEERLPAGRRLSLALHLAMCRFCRNFGRQLQWLGALVENLGDERAAAVTANERLSPEARERLVRLLREASGKAPGEDPESP